MTTRPRASALVLLLAAGFAAPAAGQARPELRLVWESGDSTALPLATDRGWAAFDVSAMERLGWSVARDAEGAVLRGPDGVTVVLREGSPYFRWNDRALQFTDPVYRDGAGGALMAPLQFASDFLPGRLPLLYDFDGPRLRLRTATGAAPAVVVQEPERRATPPATESPAPVQVPDIRTGPSPYDGPRVVIIDAGHGGGDPGSISRSGIREKDVALGVARELAARLRQVPQLEVHLIRDDDTFVEVWNRGPRANAIRGERPGVFVSVHANSFNSPARGYETYFLSEARTEHERRVAAIENAPVRVADSEVPPQDDLGFILRELRNFDHAHWSYLLADLVQQELSTFHPGPNRGVKQAPLAVLTNALMPSVLVEIGYLSHPDEARLLSRSDFQAQAGEAIADAVVRFFERYPPGAGTGAGGGR